jgi:hypothetical protein
MLTRLVVTLALMGAAVVLARRPAAPQPPVTAAELPKLVELLKSGDTAQRVEALSMLQRLEPTSAGTPAVDPLVALLRGSADPSIRTLGFEALGRLPTTSASAKFLFDAVRSTDEETRRAAARVLPAEERYAPELRAALAVDDVFARRSVVERFRALASAPAAVSGALEPLLRDGNVGVRTAVGQVLAATCAGRAELGPPLLAAATAERDPLAQHFLLAALERTGGVTPAEAPSLVTLLASAAEGSARASAARVLGGLGPAGAAATAALAKACEHDAMPLVRAAAAEALGNQGPQARSAAPLLTRLALDRERGNYRSSFVTALGQVAGPGDAKAVEAMKACANDLDESVRKEALAALERWHVPPPRGLAQASEAELLQARLEDGDVHVRQTALVRLLGLERVDARYVPGLAKALDDPGPQDQYAAKALGRSGEAGRAAVPSLIRVLGKAPLTREVSLALVALAPTDPRVLAALQAELSKGEFATAESVATALATAGKPGVAPLIAGLRSNQPRAIYAAALALARLGPAAAEAKPELLRVARTPSLLTVQYADALGGSRTAVAAALRAVAPGDAEATAAATALEAR